MIVEYYNTMSYVHVAALLCLTLHYRVEFINLVFIDFYHTDFSIFTLSAAMGSTS